MLSRCTNETGEHDAFLNVKKQVSKHWWRKKRREDEGGGVPHAESVVRALAKAGEEHKVMYLNGSKGHQRGGEHAAPEVLGP